MTQIQDIKGSAVISLHKSPHHVEEVLVLSAGKKMEKQDPFLNTLDSIPEAFTESMSPVKKDRINELLPDRMKLPSPEKTPSNSVFNEFNQFVNKGHTKNKLSKDSLHSGGSTKRFKNNIAAL